MLLTLQHRGRMTAAELAESLEVSPRTILRDVDALGSAGVPIFTVQGVGGGIELVDRFRTQLTAFTGDEAAALFLAGQPAVADQLGLGAGAAAARRKLLDALPDGLRAGAEAIDGWFLHDPFGSARRTIPYGEVRRLVKAIAHGVEVEISLADASFPAPPHAVKPLGVVLSAGSWFVAVLAEPGCEFVCVDDLRGLRLTRRTFQRAADFDLATAWSSRSRTE
jgi:predicted DNA-binding transcriptional regulator YafY